MWIFISGIFFCFAIFLNLSKELHSWMDGVSWIEFNSYEEFIFWWKNWKLFEIFMHVKTGSTCCWWKFNKIFSFNTFYLFTDKSFYEISSEFFCLFSSLINLKSYFLSLFGAFVLIIEKLKTEWWLHKYFTENNTLNLFLFVIKTKVM